MTPLTDTSCESKAPARSASSDGVAGAGIGWRPRTCIVSAISDGAKPPVSVTPWISTLSPAVNGSDVPSEFTKTPAVWSWTNTRRQAAIDVGDDAAQADAMAQRRVEAGQPADAGGVGDDGARHGGRIDEQQVAERVGEQLRLAALPRRGGGAQRHAADANLLADQAQRVRDRSRPHPDDERRAVRLQHAAEAALRHRRLPHRAADLDAVAIAPAAEDLPQRRRRADGARMPLDVRDRRRRDHDLAVVDRP